MLCLRIVRKQQAGLKAFVLPKNKGKVFNYDMLIISLFLLSD